MLQLILKLRPQNGNDIDTGDFPVCLIGVSFTHYFSICYNAQDNTRRTMAGFKDQMAMLQKLRKAQKELSNEVVEVEAGDGAVVIQFSGELKVVDVKINPDLIDLDDPKELEGWIKAAIRDGLKEAQEVAAEKMKPMLGGLGGMLGM